VTGAERAAVMRAFRKLVRESYISVYPVEPGRWWLTVDGEAQHLTPKEGKAVEKWLEEVS